MRGKEESGGTGKVRGCCNSPREMNHFGRHPGEKPAELGDWGGGEGGEG